MLQTLIALLIALTVTASSGTTPEQFYEDCWEDEVVVMVVHDPYDIAKSELACVPGDNMPWDPDGFRP